MDKDCTSRMCAKCYPTQVAATRVDIEIAYSERRVTQTVDDVLVEKEQFETFVIIIWQNRDVKWRLLHC